MNTHLHVWGRVPLSHRENLSASDLLLYIYAIVGTALQFPPLDKRAGSWGVEEQGPLQQILRPSRDHRSVITLNIFLLEDMVWTRILWTTIKWNRVSLLWSFTLVLEISQNNNISLLRICWKQWCLPQMNWMTETKSPLHPRYPTHSQNSSQYSTQIETMEPTGQCNRNCT